MFVEERQNKILELLNENGKVRVKDLSLLFKVTEDLIRKDLTTLEDRGLLKKAYGGAVLVTTNVHRESAEMRKDVNIKGKKEIAKKALSLINKNNVIFLDISTVNIEVAYLLAKENIVCTVVTNMLEIIQILSMSTNIKLFFIGGEFDYGKDGFVGELSNILINMFKFDISFMGVVAIDAFEDSVYTYMPDDGISKQHVLDNSKASYLLCEKEKFYQTGNFKYAKITDCTAIVTENNLNEKISKQLNKLGISIK
ncbi:MAG: DeoR/GlpR transcriptional regulator [Erysipelotrichaceae bacterium]|nr:DeoR/GlpR transcriptional regulator [Erysipelotrichaceae bacterium]